MATFNGRSRILGILVVAAALATGVYAFTATNTVPSSNAGAGAGAISGYTISNVQYQLNGSTPTNIDSVTFTLNSAASTAKAKLVSSSTAYTDCTIAANDVDVTCAFSPAINITAANELSVIATS